MTNGVGVSSCSNSVSLTLLDKTMRAGPQPMRNSWVCVKGLKPRSGVLTDYSNASCRSLTASEKKERRRRDVALRILNSYSATELAYFDACGVVVIGTVNPELTARQA